MQVIFRTILVFSMLSLAMPAYAQKHSRKNGRNKQASAAARQAKPRANVPLNAAQADAPAVPQEASLHAGLKNKPKVVIVPAPPPPPGPDPVPPRRIP